MPWADTIYHDYSSRFCFPPEPGLENSLTIRIRICKENPVSSVYLRTSPEGEEVMQEMHPDETDEMFVYYSTRLKVITDFTHYRFLIITPEEGFWFNAAGLERQTPFDMFDFRLYGENPFPKWMPEYVFYQIFPERFYNGDPALTVREDSYEYNGMRPELRNWDDQNMQAKNGNMVFYGGDLPGICQKMEHLEELGINGLYLTPVFHSPSNHKYDTQDYEHVDPHFGGDEALAELSREVHDREMKIVLDGVFNHVGMSHRWFNKCGFYEGGAWNNPDSPYREFFIFDDDTAAYACWKGIDSLPKLNFRSEKLRDAVYRDADAVTRYWLRAPYNIDGWRLDVANMMARHRNEQLHHEVWREFREALKAEKPEALLLGEHFFDGTDLLNGDMLDSLMNYQGFTFAVWKWLTGQDGFLAGWQRVQYKNPFTAREMASQMQRFRSRIGHQASLVMFNQLNTHDTPRFFNLVERDFARYSLGVVLLFTWPGTPCVYYGDEIGLGGGQDPDNRRPMQWDRAKWDMDIFRLYQTLVSLRRRSRVLQYGGVLELFVDDSLFAFARVLDRQFTVTVVHHNVRERDEGYRIPLGPAGMGEGQLRDVLTERVFECRDGYLELELKADEALVLIPL